MALEQMKKWHVLRDRLTESATRKEQMARALEDVEVECEEFVQALIEDNEEREDGKIVSRQRWEVGFRNIVTILLGPRTSFEIEEVVERVRVLQHEARTAVAMMKCIQSSIMDEAPHHKNMLKLAIEDLEKAVSPPLAGTDGGSGG